jgi:hypothetical protein
MYTTEYDRQVKATHLADELLEVGGPLDAAERAHVARGLGGDRNPGAEPEDDVEEVEEVAEEGHVVVCELFVVGWRG